MKRYYVSYGSCLGTMFIGALLLGDPVGWISFLAVLAYAVGRLHGERNRDILEDRIHWLEHRVDYTGDLGPGLEREVRLLRRRLAGLIARPSVAERAHRIVAALDLAPGELTEELEVITVGDKTPFSWPDLVLQPEAERSPVS